MKTKVKERYNQKKIVGYVGFCGVYEESIQKYKKIRLIEIIIKIQ